MARSGVFMNRLSINLWKVVSTHLPPTKGHDMKCTIWMLAAVALLIGGVGQANAAFVLLTSRAGLTDYVDWGQLGGDFSNAPNPSYVTSHNGLSLTVSNDQPGVFGLRIQGSFPGDYSNGWNGNFAPGDHVLWTQGLVNGPDSISLKQGFAAGGTQIETAGFGAFTAQVTAYDQNGNSLASNTVKGFSRGTADGSAVFLGIGSIGGPTIYSLGFSIVVDGATADFAINQFSFSPIAPDNVFPEPASLTLVALGALGLAGFSWCRRKQTAAVA